MVPFHMLHIVSYCAIVTLSLRHGITIFVFKKFHDLEMGVKGHSRSLRVVSSIDCVWFPIRSPSCMSVPNL